MRKLLVLMQLGILAIFLPGCIEEEIVEDWGGYGKADGQFRHPYGVAVSPLGYVYVADTHNHRIQRFTPSGEYLDKWGSYGTADGEFNCPCGMAVDLHGNVYVTDVYNHRIQKFDAQGRYLTSWGKEGRGPKEFNTPCAVAVDSAGYVYVADTENNRVQKFDSFGNFIPTKWDEPANGLEMPCGITLDRHGQVYVSETGDHQIKKFDSHGNLLKTWGGFGSGLGDFYYPDGLAIDPWGDLYVADCYNHRLQKFTSEGRFITAFGSYGSEKGYFKYPYAIAVDSQGNIYVADTQNNRIQKFWLGHIYNITPAVSYLPQDQSLQVWAEVYDVVEGKVVSQGNGNYLITKAERKLREGQLFYNEATHRWQAESFWLWLQGELCLTVVINGQSASMEFTAVSSTATVKGSVRDEQGGLVEGVTVALYRARDFISEVSNPAPVKITSSNQDGFVFNEVSPDRYIIVSEGPNGTTLSPAFWVFGQGESVATHLSVSPSRISLIEDLNSLKQKLEKQMLLQTFWMKEVSEMADLDLVLSPDLLDEYRFLTSMLKSLSEKMRDLDSELASGPQKIALETFAELLFKPAIVSGLRKETQSYLSKVAIPGIYPWYLDYADEVSRQKVLQGLPADLEWLQGDGNFGQGQYSHSVNDYKQRATYQLALAMLEEALTESQISFPEPNSRFSYQRADLVLRQSLATLESFKQGTDQIFVVPEATNPYGSLSLHLYDYYNHYRYLREKRGQVKLTEQVGADLSLIYTGGAFICLGSLVTAEAAPIFAAAAWVARGVEKVASYYEEGYDGSLLSALRLMGPKYLSNLALTPFAYTELEKFLRKEVESPYYLDKGRSFEAKITNIQLVTAGPGNRLVAFPQRGPLAPNILVTEEVPAKVEVQVGEGYSPAELRVEVKVEGPLGIYHHSISGSAQIGPDDSYVFDVPFKGCLPLNHLGDRSKMEFRLWAGPFQIFTATSDFMVVLPKREEVQTKGLSALAESSGVFWISTSAGALNQEELEEYAERLGDRKVLELAVGQNILSQDYQMADDVFACQFRAYRPLGVGVRLRVSDGQDFVGYDPQLGAARFGLPAEYSGLGSNPEVISIFNVAGRHFRVTVELDDFILEPARVILEVWETPVRPAIMVVWPESVEMTVVSSKATSFSSTIGESSHQKALLGLKVELSSLKNSQGQMLDWHVSLSNVLARGLVLAGQTESFEVTVQAQERDEGVYAGQITISSANAGEVIQPVKVRVYEVAPEVRIVYEPESGHFILSWNGQAGRVYQIQISENLNDWSAVDAVAAETGGLQSWVDQDWQECSRRFYRLKILE